MRYYLGIDNGGTNTKASLFNERGEEIGTEAISTSVLTPGPGFVERNMDEMWRDNCRVIRGLLMKTGIGAKNIAAIGVCGHGKGLYLWGKDDRPVRNGILSADNRAWSYPIQWRKDGIEQRAFEISLQHIMACQPIALLAWLRDHEPAAIEKIKWVFACKDYVRFRLTGVAKAEVTDYSGNGLMDLRSKKFSRELLRLFGLEGMFQALPPLCEAFEVCGTVQAQVAEETGLAVGTPVIGGMWDIDACALGTNVTNGDNICMIAGTWSINEYIRSEPVTDGSVLMNSLFCIPGYYLLEESSPTSAGNSEWFIRQLLAELVEKCKENDTSIYDIVEEWVSEFRPDDFIPIFLPFLSASNVDPRARAAMVGMNVSHSRKHLLRSVYEGIAFSHKYHLDKLLAHYPEFSGVIRLAGGAAHSRVWTQIFADVCGVPVQTVQANETGALGCAIAAAYAMGEYESIEEAAGNMCHVMETVYPDPDAVEKYRKKYALYLRAIDCLNGLWPDLQDFIEGK